MPRRRILLVEDDPRQRRLSAALLGEHGFEVETVPSAAGASARLAGSFDLLVTDIELGPGADGLSLALGARRRHPRLPILVMSARAPERFEELRLSGALFLRKPFTAQALLEIVRRMTA